MSYNSRKEALLNEYKGNLFEFLVSKEIAKEFQFEADFLTQFSQQAFDTLTQQEEFVRNYFPYYLDFLPDNARICAKEIIDSLEITKCSQVIVVGKSQAGKSNQEDYSEMDLVIKSDTEYHLSLKFSKYSSFVNTKSAGIKSFFSKYFKNKSIDTIQIDFNALWELEFEHFAREMHRSVDLEYTHLFENWIQNREESLPGELAEDLKFVLHTFYQKINIRLSTVLQELYLEDKELFKNSIYALIGFSAENIIQVCSFYTKNEEHLTFKKVQVKDIEAVRKVLSGDLEFKVNKTNFEIKGHGIILQIRLKPMNTFVQKGYKINCSVKFS